MATSTTTPASTVASKLVLCMEDIGQLSKDGRISGGNVSYRYLSEEKITGALQDAMVKHKLTVRPINIQSLDIPQEVKRTVKPTGEVIEAPIARVRLLNTYEWRDAESGDTLTVQSIGEGMDAGDKATNKAMTAAYKYMVRHTLAISTGDDGDAQASETTTASTYQPQSYGATPPASTSRPVAQDGQEQAHAAPSVAQPPAADKPCTDAMLANVKKAVAKKGFANLAEAVHTLMGVDKDVVEGSQAKLLEFAALLTAYTPAEVAA